MEEERKLYLPYLLNALGEASFAGELTLQEGNVQRTLVFRAGKVVNVVSQLQEETLGRILLDEGRISAEDYARLLDEMVKTGKRSGEILISLGLVGPQEIFTALEFQTKRKLLNCFKMVDFGFSLEEKKVPPEMLITQLRPAEAILTGLAEAYSVDRLLNEFPVDEETELLPGAVSERQVKMGPRDSKIFRAIGEKTTLVRLMAEEGDLQILLSALYGMHALGLVDVTDLARPGTQDLELAALQEAPASPIAAADDSPQPAVLGPDVEDTESFRTPTLKDALKKKDDINAQLAKKVLSLDRDDHFQVLEVYPSSREQEIKSAYFLLLRRFQLQDIAGSYGQEKDQQLAQQLLDRATFAYRSLSDDEIRNAYMDARKKKRPYQAPPRILADVEAQKGELALGAKRYQEAMDLFTAAMGLYPDEPDYHFKLGLAGYHKAMDETPKDETLPDHVRNPFLKTLSENPRHDSARLYLGYIAKRNGQWKRALKEFKSAAEYNRRNQRAQSEIRLLKLRKDLS